MTLDTPEERGKAAALASEVARELGELIHVKRGHVMQVSLEDCDCLRLGVVALKAIFKAGVAPFAPAFLEEAQVDAVKDWARLDPGCAIDELAEVRRAAPTREDLEAAAVAAYTFAQHDVQRLLEKIEKGYRAARPPSDPRATVPHPPAGPGEPGTPTARPERPASGGGEGDPTLQFPHMKFEELQKADVEVQAILANLRAGSWSARAARDRLVEVLGDPLPQALDASLRQAIELEEAVMGASVVDEAEAIASAAAAPKVREEGSLEDQSYLNVFPDEEQRLVGFTVTDKGDGETRGDVVLDMRVPPAYARRVAAFLMDAADKVDPAGAGFAPDSPEVQGG